jgi:hypothetical protein
VVAVGLSGKSIHLSAAAAPVASPAAVEGAALTSEQVTTSTLRSDWPAALADRAQPRSLAEGVNKFTIDDILIGSSPFETTPNWIRRLGTHAYER